MEHVPQRCNEYICEKCLLVGKLNNQFKSTDDKRYIYRCFECKEAFVFRKPRSKIYVCDRCRQVLLREVTQASR